MQSSVERRADVVVQAIGLISAIAGAVILLVLSARAASGLAVTAVAVYGFTLLAMFSCSILNAVVRHPRGKAWCNALDHSSIFALIAGTYTPFCLLVMDGARGVWLLAALWAMAVTGIFARFVAGRYLAHARIVLYVAMGWAGLGMAPAMLARMSALGGWLIVVGGIIYTLAAPLYRLSRLRYHAALWHACVVAAACCHFCAVLLALNGYQT